jgi:UDP-glucose 4-epimerase
MNALVTGGGGFIGRWVVGKLLSMGYQVTVLDNFSSGSSKNLHEFRYNPALNIVCGDLLSDKALRRALSIKPDIVFHLAARINVQHSIDNPRDTFNTDVLGTFRLLEAVRFMRPHFVMVSTCMVFAPMDENVGVSTGAAGAGLGTTAGAGAGAGASTGYGTSASAGTGAGAGASASAGTGAGAGAAYAVAANLEYGINEMHPVKPASPYAGAKLAAEHLAESYARTYGLPVTILRPFNTYGPFQRVDGEGGVIAIFLDRVMHHQDLLVYGDGLQTRDFLYVEDCADFIVRAGLMRPGVRIEATVGSCCGGAGGAGSVDGISGGVSGVSGAPGAPHNAPFDLLVGGSGEEIRIIDLARLIAGDAVAVENVPHIHPQSEIRRLLCDSSKARTLLGWQPQVSLAEGIERTRIWLRERMNE